MDILVTKRKKNEKNINSHKAINLRLNDNYIRLYFQEWYTLIDKEGKSKERYLFLFKARILVCKVRRISEDRSVFVLKDIIRVSENLSYQLYSCCD